MDINATLLGQMITFILFVWFTLKFVWPPLIKAMRERQRKIAKGLSAAERATKSLELAQQKSTATLREAKQEATHVIDQSHTQAGKIIDEAKGRGRSERQLIVEHGHKEIEHQKAKAEKALQKEVADLVIRGAKKVLEKEVDEKTHAKMIDSLITQILDKG